MRCRVYCKMDNYNRKIILLREFRGKKNIKPNVNALFHANYLACNF